MLQKSSSSDDQSTYPNSNFLTNCDKHKTSIYCVLNLLIWGTHLSVYNVQEGRTERSSNKENLMFNFLSGGFWSLFLFLL